MKRNPLVSKLSALTVAIVIVLTGSWSTPGSATTLSSADDAFFGVDSVTFDSATGLEWLDVTLSIGRSFNDLTGVDGTNEFIAGGDFAGWTYATTSQVTRFFEDAGVRNGAVGATGPQFLDPHITENPLVAEFLDSIGIIRSLDNILTSSALFDLGDTAITGLAGLAFASVLLTTDALILFDTSIDPTGLVSSLGASSNGSFLVRDPTALATIPVPPALPLFLTGLAGLGLLRRRQRKICGIDTERPPVA